MPPFVHLFTKKKKKEKEEGIHKNAGEIEVDLTKNSKWLPQRSIT